MPRVSVIVPARNASATLDATLAALAAQDIEDAYEVIVVDDGSTDTTAELAGGAGAGVELVRGPGSGPGPARNAGTAHARGALLAFTDADCRPQPGWLRAGIEALAEADLVQGVVVPDPAAARGPFDRTISVSREHGLYETANMFMRRELFDRLGGFRDPLAARLGKPLGEDVWFGWRARRVGARIAFSEAAVVEHAVFARSRREFCGERLRLVYFPALVSLIPELRGRFLWRRWFLSRRSAAFAAGVGGSTIALAAALAPAPAPLVVVPLAAWLPYAALAIRAARGWRRRAPDALATGVIADLAGFLALLAGTVRSGAPVL
jgi:glycosyltransferase involved in cell wall biosynthesis